MKNKLLMLPVLLAGTLFFLHSCEKEGRERKVSSHNESESHNMGENCMECHNPDGPGEGWFNVAGTVYDKAKTSPFPNGTLRLYTGPGGTGTLRLTLEVDALGNFFTTEDVDFGNGLYASVEGNSDTRYMNQAITTGSCNSCHGASTDRIWTE